MRLLGVTGLARSGKDHAADYLAQNMRMHKYAFAEPLKTMLKSVFGDHFHEGARSGICPETGKSYRVMMQTLGTEWGRELMDPQVWVNLVDRRWNEVEHGAHLVQEGRDHTGYKGYIAKGMVLSDVRFDSEAAWLQENSGVILEIVRPDYSALASLGVNVGIAGHASEQGITRSYITHTIVNDGSLFDFDMKLMQLVSELEGH